MNENCDKIRENRELIRKYILLLLGEFQAGLSSKIAALKSI